MTFTLTLILSWCRCYLLVGSLILTARASTLAPVLDSDDEWAEQLLVFPLTHLAWRCLVLQDPFRLLVHSLQLQVHEGFASPSMGRHDTLGQLALVILHALRHLAIAPFQEHDNPAWKPVSRLLGGLWSHPNSPSLSEIYGLPAFMDPDHHVHYDTISSKQANYAGDQHDAFATSHNRDNVVNHSNDNNVVNHSNDNNVVNHNSSNVVNLGNESGGMGSTIKSVLRTTSPLGLLAMFMGSTSRRRLAPTLRFLLQLVYFLLATNNPAGHLYAVLVNNASQDGKILRLAQLYCEFMLFRHHPDQSDGHTHTQHHSHSHADSWDGQYRRAVGWKLMEIVRAKLILGEAQEQATRRLLQLDSAPNSDVGDLGVPPWVISADSSSSLHDHYHHRTSSCQGIVKSFIGSRLHYEFAPKFFVYHGDATFPACILAQESVAAHKMEHCPHWDGGGTLWAVPSFRRYLCLNLRDLRGKLQVPHAAWALQIISLSGGLWTVDDFDLALLDSEDDPMLQEVDDAVRARTRHFLDVGSPHSSTTLVQHILQWNLHSQLPLYKGHDADNASGSPTGLALLIASAGSTAVLGDDASVRAWLTRQDARYAACLRASASLLSSTALGHCVVDHERKWSSASLVYVPSLDVLDDERSSSSSLSSVHVIETVAFFGGDPGHYLAVLPPSSSPASSSSSASCMITETIVVTAHSAVNPGTIPSASNQSIADEEDVLADGTDILGGACAETVVHDEEKKAFQSLDDQEQLQWRIIYRPPNPPPTTVMPENADIMGLVILDDRWRVLYAHSAHEHTVKLVHNARPCYLAVGPFSPASLLRHLQLYSLSQADANTSSTMGDDDLLGRAVLETFAGARLFRLHLSN